MIATTGFFWRVHKSDVAGKTIGIKPMVIQSLSFLAFETLFFNQH
jgi:hypothetical protein